MVPNKCLKGFHSLHLLKKQLRRNQLECVAKLKKSFYLILKKIMKRKKF